MSVNKLAKSILFDDFQHSILSCFPSGQSVELTRKNIIHLLDLITSKLDMILSSTEEISEKRIAEHPTISLLIHLTDILRDLENGKTSELLRPYPFGATASLSFAEQREYEAIEAAVLIAQHAYKLPSERAAAKFVSEKLNKAGHMRRNGMPFTPEFLRKLRHRSRKQVPSRRR